MGASQVRYDEEHSYVYAVIPSNLDKKYLQLALLHIWILLMR